MTIYLFLRMNDGGLKRPREEAGYEFAPLSRPVRMPGGIGWHSVG